MTAPTTQIQPPPNPSHRLLSGRDILCFSHDWTGDPLSKTHLMRLLARNNRVLWVNSIGYRTPKVNKADLGRIWKKWKASREPIRGVELNLFVLNPLAIPAYGLRPVRAINRWWLRRQIRKAIRKLKFTRPINWVFNPAAAILAGKLGEDLLIYQCVDEYTAFSGVNSTSLAESEASLLQKADVIFVSSEKLLRSKVSSHAATILVRHGVDYHHFAKALKADTVVPDEIAHLPRPIIGYFGLIAEDWVDIPLLVHLARSFPNGSIVMLGKTTMDVEALKREPNVHLLGRKPYASLPSYCKGFDVAVIPFPISEVTLNANPLKAREYLAAGLQVVSTDIPEVRVLENCRIAGTPEQFVRAVTETLENPGPRPAVSETMRTEGWDARLRDIENHLLPLIESKLPPTGA